MLSLEEEVRVYLSNRQKSFDDNTESFVKLDFGVAFGTSGYFSFDTKEKIDPYQANNWPISISEENLFIIDDLAARKILKYAPYSGVIVRDRPLNRYFFISIVDLYLMPKVRVNRSINRNQPAQKGKWLIDLCNVIHYDRLELIFNAINCYVSDHRAIFCEIKECYGSYQNEQLGRGGIERRTQHWEKDYANTR